MPSKVWNTLSGGSKASLELQGGVMTADEVEQFEREHGEAGQLAAVLRRWEDEGKNLFRDGARDPVRFDAAAQATVREMVVNYFRKRAMLQ